MKGTYLRFYVHELRKRDGEPLYDWVLNKAKAMGIHGGSAFRAISGYGRHGDPPRAALLRAHGEISPSKSSSSSATRRPSG